MTSTRTLIAGLGLAAVAAAAAYAGPASAAPHDSSNTAAAKAASSMSGSLVFVKDHNVWLANANGTGLYQVTTSGTADSPWYSPTQSDTGVIAASHGNNIVVMSQNGAISSVIDPAPLPSSVGGHGIDGPPLDLAISPDGTKVAYTMYTYGCPIGTECMARFATAVTNVDRLTPYQTYGATYLSTPSWIGNGRTLQSGGNGSHMKLVDLGQPEQLWFNDYDYAENSTDLGDGEVSPDGRWLAAVRGYGNGAHIMWYSINGSVTSGTPPTYPTPECATGEQAGFADPTWAPDSNALAWQEPDGIWVKDDPAVCEAPQPRLLIPGGSEPDWSAAAAAPAPKVFSVGAKPGLSGKAKVGKRLKASVGAWSPTPATFSFTWLRNGKPIKGATSATYKVKAKDRGKKLSVRVTGTAPGYPAKSVESPAKRVRR